MLKEVAVLRPLAILLIIVYHSFVCYTGGWKPFSGYEDCALYFWIAKMNEFVPSLFFFLSGFVFSYQRNELGRYKSINSVICRKLKRLIVPSIVFSILYLVLFRPHKNENLFENVLAVLSGVGHLWFLPSLFWCFIFGYILSKAKWRYGELSIIVLLVILSVLGWVGMALHLPFGLNKVMFYLFFFYIGCLMYNQKGRLTELCNKERNDYQKKSYLIVVLFVCLFSFKSFLVDGIETDGMSFPLKCLSLSAIYMFRMMVYICQVLIVLELLLMTKYDKWKLPHWLIALNGICFGVYVYQQFVLQVLYYHTKLPMILGSYLLPWIGLALTVLISFVAAYITKLTSIGRKLI